MEKELILTPQLKKENWGDGPWVDEPDKYFFYHKGIECAILRSWCWDGFNSEHLSLGFLCGYVHLPDNHPWKGLDMFGIDSDVHGGISYVGDLACTGEEFTENWIGFDCGHYNDIVPSVEKYMKEDQFFAELRKSMDDIRKNLRCELYFPKSYKDLNYVIEETKKLAEEVIEAISPSSSQEP